VATTVYSPEIAAKVKIEKIVSLLIKYFTVRTLELMCFHCTVQITCITTFI